MLFELGDDLVDAILWPDFVGHVFLDPVQPDQIKSVIFASLHYKKLLVSTTKPSDHGNKYIIAKL